MKLFVRYLCLVRVVTLLSNRMQVVPVLKRLYFIHFPLDRLGC